MTSEKFHKLFGQKPRDSKKDKINSISYGYCFIYSKCNGRGYDEMAASLKKNIILKNLCLAGGVALNCVANGKILEKKYLKIFGFNLQLEMREDH